MQQQGNLTADNIEYHRKGNNADMFCCNVLFHNIIPYFSLILMKLNVPIGKALPLFYVTGFEKTA